MPEIILFVGGDLGTAKSQHHLPNQERRKSTLVLFFFYSRVGHPLITL
jgi:hypothetical protein